MSKKLRCRVGAHLWVVERGTHVRTCLYCRATRKAGPDVRCHIGMHKAVPIVTDDGTRHLGCVRCAKYLGEPHSLVPWPGDRT